MSEYQTYRKLVAQKISLLNLEGGWEGSHIDFKLMLKSDLNSISKMVKHILAFANTPRKTEAYIIFGVREYKDDKLFIHEGTEVFPEADKIYNHLFSLTNFSVNDILIDDQFVLDEKKTPYIVIQQVYEGPYFSKSNFKNVRKNCIYTRYGRSSIEAQQRDKEKMDDWASWSIDLRYSSNKNHLVDSLKEYFKNVEKLTIEEKYVRFFYSHEYNDDFGKYIKKFIVHAYAGLYPIEKESGRNILKETAPNCDLCIIGPQFSSELIDLADKNNIRLIDMDKVFFKNDPYAKYCKAYLDYWKNNSEALQITKVVDLDYKMEGNRNKSIISYLDKALKNIDGSTTIVIGDFGTGKSVTAKYLTAEIARDYLRKSSDAEMVIFLNLKNYDLRAKVQDILKFELEVNCRLNSDDSDRLIRLFEENKVHMIFDSVDEMAKPYSKGGRHQVIDALRQIGNNASSIYFVRSTYFKTRDELKEMFNKLAYSARTDSYALNLVEICDLDEIQIKELFYSRLDSNVVGNILSHISKKDYKKILRDPLIVSLICNYIEDVVLQYSEDDSSGINENSQDIITQFFDDSPSTGRITFLSYLLSGLLEREQKKRKKHKASEYFDIFIGFLNEIAYHMVCEDTNYIPLERWDKLINQNILRKGIKSFEDEAIGAFRTMAWVKRDEKMNTVFFRNELLSLICASKFIITALNTIEIDHYRKRLLEDWNDESENAETVKSYTASLLTNEDIIKMSLELEKNPTSKIKKLIVDILSYVNVPTKFKIKNININESTLIGALGNCIVDFPINSKPILFLIYNNVSISRFASFLFPLLVKINDRYFDNRDERLVDIGFELINRIHEIKKEWSIQKNSIKSYIDYMKKYYNEYFDKLLIKKMGISEKMVLSAEHYKEIYLALSKKNTFGDWEKSHLEKSKKWIHLHTGDDLYRRR